jgi:hypothetical protein
MCVISVFSISFGTTEFMVMCREISVLSISFATIREAKQNRKCLQNIRTLEVGAN